MIAGVGWPFLVRRAMAVRAGRVERSLYLSDSKLELSEILSLPARSIASS